MDLIKKEQLYEGKAKKVFATQDPDYVIVSYKDDATALNGLKRGTISGKGEVNNRVSNILFAYLEKNGVPTHFVKELSPRETAVKRVSIVPVEVVVRNVAAGSLAKRLGIPEGTVLKKTVLEFYYKDDALGDPLINCSHIYALDIATKAEMDRISELALKVDKLLSEYFAPAGVRLIDYKLEFGRFHDQIILADEISPDTCRFWDDKTGEKLDKDRFRRDLGGEAEAYAELMRRVLKQSEC
jgi:phosphoribosylaminoimidazolesuccinocarboxamide synthase